MLCDIWHGERTTVSFFGLVKIINIIIPKMTFFSVLAVFGNLVKAKQC